MRIFCEPAAGGRRGTELAQCLDGGGSASAFVTIAKTAKSDGATSAHTCAVRFIFLLGTLAFGPAYTCTCTVVYRRGVNPESDF